MCSDDDGIQGNYRMVQRRTDRQRKRQKLLSLRLRQERKLPQRPENEATMLPGGENPEGTGAEAESEYAPFVGHRCFHGKR